MSTLAVILEQAHPLLLTKWKTISQLPPPGIKSEGLSFITASIDQELPRLPGGKHFLRTIQGLAQIL